MPRQGNSAARLGAAVADVLARRRHHGLTGADVERAALVLDAQQALQHDRDLLERRPLPRLLPALR